MNHMSLGVNYFGDGALFMTFLVAFLRFQKEQETLHTTTIIFALVMRGVDPKMFDVFGLNFFTFH